MVTACSRKQGSSLQTLFLSMIVIILTTTNYYAAVNAFFVPSSSTLTKHSTKLHAISDASRAGGGGGASSSSFSSSDDKELIPTDPASTTPQFLCGLWNLIAEGNNLVRGEEQTVRFPNMANQFTARYLNLVTAHLDSCKDVCDFFGISTTLVPYVEQNKVTGFTIRSFRNPDKDPDAVEFGYDPFWDEDDIPSYEGVDDEFEDFGGGGSIGGSGGTNKQHQYPDIVNKIPDDDEEIVHISKQWVNKICSDMGICPFSNGPDMAGLPLGPVHYCVDRSTSMEDMYARYWKEVVHVEQKSEQDLSTTLLIAPEFCMDNVELFENFSTTLTQPLTALGVEDLLQLVFFHPHWSFRDGGGRAGGDDSAAANYARRSPWPMINILRTKQVRAAQKGIPTGLVYKQNEKTLASVGVEKLETMLRLRDWEPIANVKVNRREMEALRVARDFQQSGVVSSQDTSFASDATPAASKVDSKQVEQGDLVNVIAQALEKRLGKSTDNHELTRLSGPETSATIMAGDFLVKELENIIASGGGGVPSKAIPKPNAAQQAILDDLNMSSSSSNQEETDMNILLGKGGLMDGPAGPRKDRYASGMNPDSFY